MYTKDKHTRVTLRLTDRQFEYVKAQSEMLGVSPSETIRMLINACIYGTDTITKKEASSRENDKANINNIL